MVILFSLFVLSRAYLILFFKPQISDIRVYGRYAFESKVASRKGISLYEYHEQRIQHLREEAVKNVSPPPLPHAQTIEYPPLAVVWIQLPSLLIRTPIEYTQESYRQFIAAYVPRYRILTALMEFLGFLLVLNVLRKIFPRSPPSFLGLRALFFLAVHLLLAHVLYDRLDLVLAVTVTASLALLILNKGYGWSFFLLALAIHFKMIPAVLIPVWIVGSLPGVLLAQSPRFKTMAWLVMKRLILIIFWLVIGMVPFVMTYGKACLDFWSYHQERGIQIESVYGSLLIMADALLGIRSHVYFNFGSENIASRLSPILIGASPWILLGLLSGASWLLWFTFFRKREGPHRSLKTGTKQAPLTESYRTIANRHPGAMVLFSLLFLMVGISASKVFSVQYLLLFVPLLAILPSDQKALNPAQGIFVLICLLTGYIFPYHYWKFVGLAESGGGEGGYLGPSLMTGLVSIIRNGLFVGLTVFLAIRIFRMFRGDLKSDHPA